MPSQRFDYPPGLASGILMTGSVDESTVDQKVPRPMSPLGEFELQDFLPGFLGIV